MRALRKRRRPDGAGRRVERLHWMGILSNRTSERGPLQAGRSAGNWLGDALILIADGDHASARDAAKRAIEAIDRSFAW